jgi:hypothetical protein
MREFSSTNFRIRQAPFWQKVLYSSILGLLLLGVGTNLLLGLTRTGLTSGAIADYYRGNPERLMFEKTFQELLEVTHVHAFMMPIVLLVLGHLFFLTDWSARAKRLTMVVAVVAMTLELLAPWAVRYLDPAWAHVKLVAGYAFGTSLLCLIGAPLYDMWFRNHSTA